MTINLSVGIQIKMLLQHNIRQVTNIHLMVMLLYMLFGKLTITIQQRYLHQLVPKRGTLSIPVLFVEIVIRTPIQMRQDMTLENG